MARADIIDPLPGDECSLSHFGLVSLRISASPSKIEAVYKGQGSKAPIGREGKTHAESKDSGRTQIFGMLI